MLVGTHKILIGVKLLLQIAGMLMLLAVDALAITPPGTEIRNQAVLTYQDQAGDEHIAVLSNISTLGVSEYFAFSLSSTHQVVARPGNTYSFTHQIHNTGNVVDTFGVSALISHPDSGLIPLVVSVALDVNGNGVADAGESQGNELISLEPGASVDLVVTVSVPSHATIGTSYALALSAENSRNVTKAVSDVIDIETGALFSLIKAANPGCHVSLFPGDEISHEIDIVNNGNSAVEGVSLMLDGDRVSGVIVQQLVPSLMSFSRFEPREFESGAKMVVRLSGVAENSWISHDQWDQTTRVISAGLFFADGTFGPQAQDYFNLYTVVDRLDSDIKMQITSAMVDLNGDRSVEFESNRTCHTYSVPGAARQAQLRFVEPSQAVHAAGRVAEFGNDADFSAAVHYLIDAEDDTGYQAAADGIYLELELTDNLYDSSNIHYDGNRQRYIETVVESALTGDQVTVLMLETASPGVFRSIAPVRLSEQESSGGGYCPSMPNPNTVLAPSFENPPDSCVLASISDDELLARYLDSERGFAVAEVALVNPRALVFNAQTGLPVAGARVMIREVITGELAWNRVTGMPVEIVTGTDGLYTIPRLDASKNYYLDVEPPQSHSFPSVVRSVELETFYVENSSYGLSGSPEGGDGSFSVGSDTFTRPVDIPLDSAIDGTLLVVEKMVQSTEVEIGQLVSYTVTVNNLDENVIQSLVLEDKPPYGYRYVAMSASVDGDVLPEPDVGADGMLSFDLGEFEPGQMVRVGYSLRVTAAAVDSDGINQASVRGITLDNAQVVSPLSTVGVQLRKRGVLSDRAALFGKIYVDQDCDGQHSLKEWPIGGVRLYLQDGTYTVSDADGLFSLYGLNPGNHVLKIDNHTLPAGISLKPLDSNQAVDAGSRFIDLMAGDFYRADFAALCPEQNVEQVFAEIKARNESINGAWLLKEVEGFEAGEEQPLSDPGTRVKSLDGDLSNGLLNGPVREEDGTASISQSPSLLKKIIASQKTKNQPLPNPKKLVSEITQPQAKAGTWLWPTGELSIRGRFMVVVRDGIEPTLYVNDEPVAVTQIGERLANRREKAQIVAWYGVELRDGENTVEVKGIGPFGNERILASAVFKKPSSGASIKISPVADTIQADGGRSALAAKVEVLDAQGYPALGAYFVTLESSDGSWLEPDIQDSEPGRQIRIDDGSRVLHYVSSAQTGEVTLRASTGEFSDEVTVQQVTESRPLIATGLLEAGVTLSSASYGAFSPSKPLAGLDGNSRLYGRAAIFAKGRVKGKFNLTLSYDSDKESDTELLRDINPTLHYPVHGDASVRGFEAQSRSKLYVKVEEEKNSLMWGDFLTDSASDHEDLARSRRTLTGFNSVIDSEVGRFRLFASRQQDKHVSEEVAGNGSAMLYRLESYPIVTNSEVVELVTRSRENEGLILARTRLSRFGDYTIDPVYGYITFSTVVPTLDDQQNPVSVQISYDVEIDGKNYWVTGLRFDRQIDDRLQFGVSHTNDHNSQSGISHTGAYTTYQAGDDTRISASIAASKSVDGRAGNAARVSVDHRWSEDSRTTFTYARADAAFQNSGASVASGRTEIRLNHKLTLDKKTSVVVDALQSQSLTNSDGRRSLGAQIEHRLRDWLLRAGLRQITQEELSGKDQYVTATLGVNRQIVFGGRSGQFEAELEQDTGKASRHRVRVGGKLQVHDKARIYSNFELANSLLALNGVSNSQKTEMLTIGVESDVLPSTRLYSEYRMRGAFDNRDHETASGIRADIELEPDLRVSPNFEIIKSAGTGDSLAASIGLVDTRNENSRRLLRVETRQAQSSDYLGLRASYAARLNEDWTSVFTENLSRQDNAVGEDTRRHSFVAGLSRRPKLDNKHHMLLMYNWKEEAGISAGLRRSVHLLSTHQNLQLNNRALVSGRVGGKHHSEQFAGQTISGFSLLADVRLNFDFDRRFNMDIRGGVLATDGMSEMRYSAGAELYYVLNRNMRFGIGYNFGGFRDEDLDAEESHTHGWRFGLQYKFDEDSLKWLE